MSLLDVITKAASVNVEPQSEYPIVLNSDDVFLNLKANAETPNPSSLASPVTGWQLAETDVHLIELGKKFYCKLKRKLKDINHFNKDEFFGILNPFLEKMGEKIGISVGVSSSDNGYTQVLIEKIGFLMGRDVTGLVLEACLSLEIWDLVETLIIKGLVDYSCYSNLVKNLVANKRSDLLCLSIKHAPDLGLSELLCILKYFLCPSKEAYSAMANVRKEWESQALLAIEKVRNKNLPDKKLRVAKEAAILLMLAHDGFSTSELCLHYLLASVNIDEVILSSSIGKLNGKEMMSFIKYLGKWLKKYETFPQASPCPKASSTLGLKGCDWVPKLEDIVKCLGLVLDENFSTLVLHPEFHEELRSIEGLVASLALEAKFCSSVANIIEILKTDGKGEQK
ncbi:uncharacterized protein LOC8277376 [Ricinus communis]|uniref:Uncharacterized protein n=1 Tax=Ricinus communis TaxID=3988 RepID=B9R959_RICCO|nr:uncharacterized protein LOC8277376 [Ricinus communis]XP_015578594.1 uncharacterized protein LOC8277376 [Ricinus communis]EEF52136.1 conserved hypothetical protein [Ricinus communis]|eukprot:XP_002511534.1 uncharacterized protein LOC8277376 [Ricinus communis]